MLSHFTLLGLLTTSGLCELNSNGPEPFEHFQYAEIDSRIFCKSRFDIGSCGFLLLSGEPFKGDEEIENIMGTNCLEEKHVICTLQC